MANNGLMPCPQCGGSISPYAQVCPHCGLDANVLAQKRADDGATGCGFVVLIIGLVWFLWWLFWGRF